MIETLAGLQARKRDIYAALRILEQDFSDGAVDAAAYRRMKQRYESEAAEILARLDELVDEQAEGTGTRPRRRRIWRWRSWIVAGGAVVLILGAIAVFLAGAVHARRGSQSITGSQPGGVATTQTSPQLRAAEQAVLVHPRSITALLDLGNAYLHAGDTRAADRSYQRAIQLGPNRPEARTLHAMILGATGRSGAALTLLRQVEHDRPGYARAWLVDGLLAGRNRAGYARAIAAWRRFLALQPTSSVSPQVRDWIAAAVKAQRRGR